MKIRIIGGPGSGKSFLAERLSRRCGIPCYELDELQWDSAAESYGTKRPAADRDALLQEILDRDAWIIEGVYVAWCAQTFAEADRICLLSVPRSVYRRRIIRRFLRRKIGLEKGKRETLRDLRALLRWADKYQRETLPAIREVLAPYAAKLVETAEPEAFEESLKTRTA